MDDMNEERMVREERLSEGSKTPLLVRRWVTRLPLKPSLAWLIDKAEVGME
jgi:hypothetical protein